MPANKEEILKGNVSSGNEGRLAEASMQVPNTTAPKATNSENHGGKQDIASTEKSTLTPASHGNNTSNSQGA